MRGRAVPPHPGIYRVPPPGLKYALKIRGHNHPSDCCRFSPQALPFVTPIKRLFFLSLFNIDEKNLVFTISTFSTV